MKYTIELTQQEMNLIFLGLGELPLKSSLNLFFNLKKSVEAQDTLQAKPLEEIMSDTE